MPANKRAVHAADFQMTVKRWNTELLHALPQAHRRALTHAMYHAYWVQNQDLSSLDILIEIATRVLPPEVIATLHKPLDMDFFKSDELAAQLRQTTQEAVDRGAPGVPSFYVIPSASPPEPSSSNMASLVGNNFYRENREGRLYWGRDRLHFVDPWSFIGWTQLPRMMAEAAGRLEIEYVPVLVGALFKAIGTPNLPLFSIPPIKREYNSKDMYEWCEYWSALPYISDSSPTLSRPPKVDLVWPSVFPIRTVLPLRVAILNPRTIDCMFRAAWSQDINIGDPELLSSVLSSHGFDADLLLDKAGNDPALKEALRKNTEEAVHKGVCGVPSYEIKDHIIWGHDRMDVIMDMVQGWDGETPIERAHAPLGTANHGRPRL
ncbi:hypothetical protein HK102_013177 [Quaeritorhiza haematococci]|nr:hypothetical protein HK102_013177 [Quaeritorhiza haematococci]